VLRKLIGRKLGGQDASQDKENISFVGRNSVPSASTWHAGIGEPYALGLASHEFGKPCGDCGAVVARRMYACIHGFCLLRMFLIFCCCAPAIRA
jgi:hypothetical protein